MSSSEVEISELWDNDCIENVVYDFVTAHIFGLGLIAQTQTVPEDFVTHGTDIFRNHIASAFDEGVGLGGSAEGDAGTRRSTVAEQVLEGSKVVVLRVAACENYIDNVSFNLFVHIHFPHHFAGTDDILCAYNGRCLRESGRIVHTDNEFFFFLLRVIDENLEHETVNLGLRKRIGSLLLHRVLGSHHKERLGKGIGIFTESHLMLLHCLEQGRLHFGRGAVDFVGKHEVGENRAFVNFELFVFLTIDKGTCNICRKQVRSELDAGEIRVHRLGKSADCQCFGKTGHTFEENMSSTQKGNLQILHKLFLPYDNLPHLKGKQVHKGAFLLDSFVQFLDVYTFHIFSLNLYAMRYKITLSYNGADFCGWQIQPHDPSVQETLQKALSTLLGGDISLTGAGRTDTGVHARNYTAHFDYPSEIGTETLIYKLNAILPPSIAIHSIEKTRDDFHARFDARRREYCYYIHRCKDPFANSFSYYYPYGELDLEAMNRAAALLTGRHDFSSFEKSGSDNKNPVCTVFEACWYKEDENHWYFRIAADRFLRNMVRSIVGTLLEVGRGKRAAESIPELIESRDRCLAGQSVPGKALFLSKVEYF